MGVINKIIELKSNGLSFGNYLIQEKQKLDDFEFNGDKYKVKTHNEITRLEKNGVMLFETVPGSTVHELIISEKNIEFSIEGFKNTEITLSLEANKNYKLKIDEIDKSVHKANSFGKFSFSMTLSDQVRHVIIEKID